MRRRRVSGGGGRDRTQDHVAGPVPGSGALPAWAARSVFMGGTKMPIKLMWKRSAARSWHRGGGAPARLGHVAPCCFARCCSSPHAEARPRPRPRARPRFPVVEPRVRAPHRSRRPGAGSICQHLGAGPRGTNGPPSRARASTCASSEVLKATTRRRSSRAPRTPDTHGPVGRSSRRR